MEKYAFKMKLNPGCKINTKSATMRSGQNLSSY